MFDLTSANTDVQTMTSCEIAELTGKEHTHVMRDIRIMLEELGESENPDLVSQYQGLRRMEKCYKLPKRETLILVSGYSVELRARIIDRWEELENKQRQPAINLHDPKQLLGLLHSYAEENLKLQEQVEEAAPKVEFVDNYVEATGVLGFREVAKLLDVKESFLRDWLISKSIIYRLGSNWVFSHYWLNNVKRGLHKVVHVNGKARTSIKFTPKGFAYIAQRISK